MQTINSFLRVWTNFLNLVFPHPPDNQAIENLSLEKFLSLSKPARKPPVTNTLSVVSYKSKIVKQAIHSVKFKNNQSLIKLFAQVIYDYLGEELAILNLSKNFNDPLLITIPLHRSKYRQRGYNQTELIAKEMEKIDQDIFFQYKKGVLKKIKKTPAQSRLKNKQQRLENLQGCFKLIQPEAIKDRNIIILDDVITTGATLTEAIRTLKQQGQPQKILCITLAH